MHINQIIQNKYRFIYQINLVVITFNLILKKLENLKLNI